MRRLALACAAIFLVPTAAVAQPFDPRPTLNTLISAFQNCGPAATYQSLAPELWQVIYMQTGGSGCYAQIQAAGQVQDMQIVDSRQFPVGPVYAVRVSYASGTADWFIGFNQLTGRVQYLTFQPAQGSGPAPTVESGPRPTADGPSTPPPSRPTPNNDGDGCDLYPVMCQ